ncbi:hypothetical protein TSUD_52290 [Trifolium subterraneum]|uniref:Uncharacterized protein n=1 Tax=Trifolium subterraneum TaxID=3900 RepID=A0A2Z6N0U9_TRISU|nr:hypothetical protein TSUD_52290 [Trifolium subterraneum]
MELVISGAHSSPASCLYQFMRRLETCCSVYLTFTLFSRESVVRSGQCTGSNRQSKRDKEDHCYRVAATGQ